MRLTALGSPYGFEDVLEPFQGRNAAQFKDQVLLRSRHDKPFADRTAALRGHGSHGNRSGELHSHHAPVEALIIEEQSILSRILASAGEAPAKRYDPNNPMADKDGNIFEAAVDETRELVDMMETARSYQNNVEVMQTAKTLILDTIKMGR